MGSRNYSGKWRRYWSYHPSNFNLSIKSRAIITCLICCMARKQVQCLFKMWIRNEKCRVMWHFIKWLHFLSHQFSDILMEINLLCGQSMHVIESLWTSIQNMCMNYFQHKQKSREEYRHSEPPKKTKTQIISLQTCPEQAISVNSRVYPFLPTLFLSFFSRFCWIYDISKLVVL